MGSNLSTPSSLPPHHHPTPSHLPQLHPSSQPTAANAASPTDSVLGELGSEVTYDKSLGTSRFLKTIRARHKSGGVVVIKVFIKPDPSVSLKGFHRRIKAEKEALTDCPNVLPYQRILETEKSGYLIRQWVGSNLYDRISTRPFLTSVEKRWVTFQLLMGLKGARERGIAHGDIKTENILCTSTLQVLLTDFSTAFKPTHIPLDDPSTFSYYFDTSARRICYLAPERFYPPGSDIAKRKEVLEWGKRDGKVTEAMDVFALGCVVAEVWAEKGIMTLSEALRYREGEWTPEAVLDGIDDIGIRDLIKSMISLDPMNRLTTAQYLENGRGSIFPTGFYDYLHPFLEGVASGGTSADEVVELLESEWESVVGSLENGEGDTYAVEKPVDGREVERRDDGSPFPIRLHIPGVESVYAPSGSPEDGPALIILTLLLSHIRNCLRPSSILRALDLLLALGKFLSDETRLDRLVPYLVVLLEDDVAIVRAGALKSLTETLVLTKTITPSNTSLFPEYIFPNTRPLATDSELLVRTTYAKCLLPLAEAAKRFLEMKESMRTEGRLKLAEGGGGEDETEDYDTSLVELHAQVQDHLTPLLTDASPVVKRALLSDIGPLCAFFGRAKANDAVLAHLVTYLNTRDWQLRAAWNKHAVEVAKAVGARSLEEYILPLMTLSLSDAEEFVTVKVLSSLTTLAERRTLAKGKIWELVAQTTGLLCHPNIWIREGTAAFLTAVAKKLQQTDRWCILYPTIRRLLRADVKDITALALLDNAREPLSRVIFEAAVAWATKSGKSQFWSLTRAPTKGAVRTDEEHAQLEKMRQLGMKPEDEYKVSILREFIPKLAVARQASASRMQDSPDPLTHPGGEIVLQELGVIPQTIIFRVRSPTELSNASSGHLRFPDSPRRFSIETPRSPSSVTGLGGGSRNPSGQPIEDLRRRLALVGGVAPSVSPFGALGTASPPVSDSPRVVDGPLLERTVSHTSSAEAGSDVGGTGTPTPRDLLPIAKSKSRVHLNGVDVGRVAPAIAQDSTNAMGFFNVDARYNRDEDAMSGTNVMSAMPGAPSKRGSEMAKAPSQRFFSTYEGNDPHIKQLVERGFLDNFREPVPELGPHVPEGVPRSRALHTSFLPRERRPTRPEGKLIAHLVEHKSAISSIQVSPDQLFFATGSEDGTVKIWDTVRLEKNVTSKSRHTYVQGGFITGVCILHHSHCVASASDNGTLWIHRVDIDLTGAMPRYSKPHLIRQRTMDEPGEFITCMTSYNTQTTTNLVFGTSLSTLVVLDVRTMRNLHEYANPPHFGPISCVCVDPAKVWLVVGTTGGVMTLWDLRFGLLLRSWTVSKRRVHQVSVHPCRGKGRWVILALEEERSAGAADPHGALVAEVWDIDRGIKVEEYRTVVDVPPSRHSSSNGETGFVMQEATLDPAAAIEALVAASQIKPRGATVTRPPGPGVRTFIAGLDYAGKEERREGGFLLTGGEDRKIRFWDLEKVDRSAVVSGLELEDDRPAFTAHTSTSRPSLYLESPPVRPPKDRATSKDKTPKVHRSTLIATSQTQLLSGHQDAVSALAVLDLPFRCVVSGDRSGVVKVFE